MESLNSKAVKALQNMIHKFDNDPNYRKQVLFELNHMDVIKDSQLICSVLGDEYNYNNSVGDLLMYGYDHDYPNKQMVKAHNLFYQWHGCGD